MEDDIVEIPEADLLRIQEIRDRGTNLFEAYEIALRYIPEGSDRYFWFENAVNINRRANGLEVPGNSDAAPEFILRYTQYGLLMDQQEADVSSTSNSIATAVLNDILISGGVLPFDVMLQNDIHSSLELGGQTVGGWGGGFLLLGCSLDYRS